MKSAVERACELARSGKFNGIRDVEIQLRIERYETHALFQGASFKRQLRALIQASQIKDVATSAIAAVPEVTAKFANSAVPPTEG